MLGCSTGERLQMVLAQEACTTKLKSLTARSMCDARLQYERRPSDGAGSDAAACATKLKSLTVRSMCDHRLQYERRPPDGAGSGGLYSKAKVSVIEGYMGTLGWLAPGASVPPGSGV